MEIKRTSFKFQNGGREPIVVAHEPEGFEFNLMPGEHVMIEVDSGEDTFTFQSGVVDGVFCIGIWDGRGSQHKITYNGEDPFLKYFT